MTRPLDDLPGANVYMRTTNDGPWPAGTGQVHVEQRLVGPADRRRLHANILLPAELLAESAFDVGAYLEQALDRPFRPWRYPDPPAIPVLEPLPAIAALERAWHRAENWLGYTRDHAGGRLDAYYRNRRRGRTTR